MSKFDIWVRRMSDRPWRYYGTFSSEREYEQELPHIETLGLAVQRRKYRTVSISAPNAAAGGAGTPAGPPQRIPAGEQIRREQAAIRRMARIRRERNERSGT